MPPTLGNKKLRAGEMVGSQKGKTMALRWYDKKAVCLISTIHNAATILVLTKDEKEILKPQVVLNYNNTM